LVFLIEKSEIRKQITSKDPQIDAEEMPTMSAFVWLQKLGLTGRLNEKDTVFLPASEQIRAWRKANHKMEWGILPDEFDVLEDPPLISPEDRRQGFNGTVLFYGFGDDGSGSADAVLSGKLAWEYACKRRNRKTWQCEYVDFQRPEDIRLRSGAPGRPRGFYWAFLHTGERNIHLTVSQVRKKLETNTGCASEGFQLLAVTHPHFADLMTERKMPFMALADYDVAPHGFNDFYDAPQLFCSNHILGLGIGNVDRNYPLFGIPTLRLLS
jgi:uncharacterized protein YndB with AHSA1/START domain